MDSWPNGYPALEREDGDYRYPQQGMDPYAADPYAPAAGEGGGHPYGGYNGYAQQQPPAGNYAASDIEAFGYGDPGYSNPGYQGPSSQDTGITGIQTVHGFVDPAGPRGGPADMPYSAPVAEQAGQSDIYHQPWDYDQPLRYDDEPSYPMQDSYGQTTHAPEAFNQGGYGGPDYPAPGFSSGAGAPASGASDPGYDLSGIIGTGDFPNIAYDQPSYDRLSYDDPRYDSPYGAGSGDGFGSADGFGSPEGFGPRDDIGSPDGFGSRDQFDAGDRFETGSNTRFDMPAVGEPLHSDTSFDMPALDEPRRGDTRFDMPAVEDAPRHSNTRFDMPAVDDDSFRVDHFWPGREDIAGSGSLNRTSMDLSGGRENNTRFDMPAVDDYQYGDDFAAQPGFTPGGFAQTSAEGMYALEDEFRSSGNTGGLVVPADSGPMNWADETSFDRYAGEAEMDAPPAFTRAAESGPLETGMDTGSVRRAGGKRRGRSGDKREWIALGAIAVVAAGAIGGVMMKYVFGGPGGPAHTVSTPAQVAGFERSPSLEKQMKITQLRQSTVATGNGKLSDVQSAAYQQGSSGIGSNPQTYAFVGGKIADSDAPASLRNFENTYKAGGAHSVNPGSLGGQAGCGTASVGGESVSMCVWFDNDTFGQFVSPTMTPAQLATTMEKARPDLEHLAK